MSGLLRRIRRPGAAEETRTEATALPEPAHGSAPASRARPRADGQPPARRRRRPRTSSAAAATGRRGKLRRRARFLRRARELALRDLGGLVYEARRREQDGGKLVEEKVQRLGAIDEELHALEAELGTPRGETVLREPGVGGTCPRCGELHASDAHFCSRCGARPDRGGRGGAPERPQPRSAAAPAAAASEAGRAAEQPRPTSAAPPSRPKRREPHGRGARRAAAEPADEPPTAEPDRRDRRAGNGRDDRRDADRPEPADDPRPRPLRMTEVADSAARHRAGVPALRRRRSRPTRSGA